MTTARIRSRSLNPDALNAVASALSTLRRRPAPGGPWRSRNTSAPGTARRVTLWLAATPRPRESAIACPSKVLVGSTGKPLSSRAVLPDRVEALERQPEGIHQRVAGRARAAAARCASSRWRFVIGTSVG